MNKKITSWFKHDENAFESDYKGYKVVGGGGFMYIEIRQWLLEILYWSIVFIENGNINFD